MDNDDIRFALKLWGQSGQIERHRFPLIAEEFRCRFFWFGVGAFAGFFFAMAVAGTILSRGG